MTGHDYERVVAAYLRNKGYSRVKVTKASGDYGVDVIAHKGKKKYAVQCKYYSSPVSLGAVQEAVAGKAMYGCNAAMVVTNNTFTRSAEELAKKNGVVLIPGVNSTGITLKGVLKTIIRIYIIALTLVAIGAVASVIEQAKVKNYEGAFSDISLLLFILLFGLGIPMGIKTLSKCLKIGVKSLFRRVIECIKKAVTGKKTEKDIFPEQLAAVQEMHHKEQQYLNTNISTEYTSKLRKSHDEMKQALIKLKNEDTYVYSHLHEIFKRICENKDNKVRIGSLQRQMKIGFNRALYLMDMLEKIGFIEVEYINGGFLGKIVVTEQEIIELLAEVERINTPT